MFVGKYIEMYSEDLRLKNYATSSIKNYCSQISLFLKEHESVATKPTEISEALIKRWLLKTETINSRKHRLSALKLFYKYTIKQPMKLKSIEYPRSERKLPRVIDKDFLVSRITAIENKKHKAILTLAYSVGLRVSEVINLKIEDVDSARMVIYIKNAKGAKDRVVPLSQTVLACLRDYYKDYRPKEYMFNGQFSNVYSPKSCNEIVKKYIGKEQHFHLLRHSSFTAMLESGIDLRIIQSIAGHKSSRITEIYTHVSNNLLNKIALPI